MKPAPRCLIAVLGALLLGGCAEEAPQASTARAAEPPAPPPAEIIEFVAPTPAPGQNEIAVLTVREIGEIHIELLADKAPETVANFKKLAEEGFYDGTTFHRIIPDFMIQGGDPNSKDRDPRNDGRGGPGYTLEDEFSDVAHVRGVVSMANKGHPNSAGSQFFIVVSDSSHLDGKYTAFGVVTQGMDVADQVVSTPRDVYGRHGPTDRPLQDVVIESIRIEPPQSVAPAPGEAGVAPPPEERAT